MKPEVQELMDKARRSLKVAENIFNDGEVDFAGLRAYYAMLRKHYFCSAVSLFPVILPLQPISEKSLPERES